MSEQTIVEGGASTPEPNIIDDLTGFTPVKPNGPDAEPNIDAMFGNGDAPADGTPKPTGDPVISSPAQTRKQTPEEYMKELQSRTDKSTNRIKELEAVNKELSGAAEFVEQLYHDEEVFKAFIAEINPELVKPSTPEEHIKNGLRKEFGDDFVPEEAEENIRGSRTWLYNKRADALYEEAVTRSNSTPENIRQLKDKRAKLEQDNLAKATQEKQKILTDFQWNEDDYTGFLKWANGVSALDFAKLYQYGKSKLSQRSNAPNLASVPGGSPLSDSAYTQELNDFFGK